MEVAAGEVQIFPLEARWADVQKEFGKELVREYLEIHIALQNLPI